MLMLRCLGHGCNINNNLVMIIISSFTLILLVGNCPMVVAAGREKLVVELEMMSKSNSRSSSSSSSEELVVLEMAGGYGDKKLSTVLVIGTLLRHDDPCNLAPHPRILFQVLHYIYFTLFLYFLQFNFYISSCNLPIQNSSYAKERILSL